MGDNHPHVIEGYTRLRNACQINRVGTDEIDKFLFGVKYRPGDKLSIQMIAKGSIRKLGMLEENAINFGRYLVETSGISGNFDIQE